MEGNTHFCMKMCKNTVLHALLFLEETSSHMEVEPPFTEHTADHETHSHNTAENAKGQAPSHPRVCRKGISTTSQRLMFFASGHSRD